MTDGPLRCPCEGRWLEPLFSYDEPPAVEVAFDLGGAPYRREVHRCGTCSHFVSVHDLDLSKLYEGAYVDANYRSPDGLRATFDRIVALSPERSDNVGRAQRVHEVVTARLGSARRRLLDVGAGLGVFPHAMVGLGWQCTAIDPDERAAAHIASVTGADAVCGDFVTMPLDGLGPFDVVTFNKVLEHVADSVGMLTRAVSLLAPGGIVYIELPDGEAAAAVGKEREEFTIDHLHAFSAASISMLATRAGLEVVELERLEEPSTKLTLRAFATAVTTTARDAVR